MAKRSTTEDQLALLKELRAAPDRDHTEALRMLLGPSKAHGIVIKGAAQIALQAQRRSLADDIAAAAQSLAPPDGSKRDPGCEGKLACLQALIEWEVKVPALYVAAAKWIQREPVQRGSIDTAAGCRGLAAIGIARTRPEGAILLLIDLVADPEAITRQNAAMALGMWNGSEAMPLLRLKARVGDESPDVLGEVLAALIRDNPREHFTFIAGFLDDKDSRIVEAAAIALGQSRLPEALEPLTRTLTRVGCEPIHTSVLMAIALLRTDESLNWLLEQLKTATPSLGVSVLDALAIYRGDRRIIDRIMPLTERDRRLASVFRELFS